MKFEVKKKVIADAAKVVKTMLDALSASGATADIVHLVAEGSSLKIRSVIGKQVVERHIKADVTVTEDGTVAVDPNNLTSALSVSGDTFKAALDGTNLIWGCGRAKGRIETKDVEEVDTTDVPKATLSVPGFQNVIKAMTLKSAGGSNERIIHVDAKTRKLRGESTDSLRGISVVAHITNQDKIPFSADISLPPKALDTLAHLLDDNASIGYDEGFFSVRVPGLFVSMPQSATPARDIAGDIEAMLDGQSSLGSYTVTIKELVESIKDAATATSEANAFALHFGPTAGKMLSEGGSRSIEVDFSYAEPSKISDTVKVQTAPSLLLESFNSVRVSDKVVLSVYQGFVMVDLPEETSTIVTQTTIVPVADVTVEPAEQRKVAKAKPAAAAKEQPAKAPKRQPVVEDEDEFDDEE